MKIVVIGGTGLIGSKVVARLRALDHEVVVGSPSNGINTMTGEGLAAAMEGAAVVVDLSNSPSFADHDVLDFFTTSGRNLFAAELAAGVRHHIALGVVGTERLQDSGYFRGKAAQEKLIAASGVPYTIVRSTQFFEFLGGIAQAGTAGGEVRLSNAHVQPIATDDIAAAVARAALGQPVNGQFEVAGPERVGLADLVRRYLAALGDARKVVADPDAAYFGVKLDDKSLTPGANAQLGAIRFEEWMAANAA
jgi:uncharacterized protein YbjT (DUF2867 family)